MQIYLPWMEALGGEEEAEIQPSRVRERAVSISEIVIVISYRYRSRYALAMTMLHKKNVDGDGAHDSERR